MTTKAFRVSPNPALELLPAYVVGRPESGIDLVLDFNESTVSPASLVLGSNLYPELNSPLEGEIADYLGVESDQVLVTCGADDGLQRAVFSVAAPGRTAILLEPGYSMIRRFVCLAGAEPVAVPWWTGDLPVAEIRAQSDETTSLIAVVSPANPTGSAATKQAIATLCQALPHALVLVDQAYLEFAAPDLDLGETVLAHPNAVLVRTFSKAWGAAGLRVGFAVGDARVIDWMRRVGLPFPVSRPAAEAVSRLLSAGPDRVRIERIKQQRDRLQNLLRQLGVEVWSSQGSFVLARFADADLVWRGLASFGIAVRRFRGKPQLDGFLRITLPGEEEGLFRLQQALTTILSPEALLFDMDGVLADVSGSYRAAIEATAATYGITVNVESIREAKAAGNATNDWILTQRLLSKAGVEAPLEQVTHRFEALYQGNSEAPGLRRFEKPLFDINTLKDLAARMPLGVVTGRPRADAERFLAEHGLIGIFSTVVCMEDAECKPDPAPVRLALRRLGVSRAWMLGDTPDDVTAARGASVLPIGVLAPGDPIESSSQTLTNAGAARIFVDPTQISEVLP